jgi:hypothetical protein
MFVCHPYYFSQLECVETKYVVQFLGIVAIVCISSVFSEFTDFEVGSCPCCRLDWTSMTDVKTVTLTSKFSLPPSRSLMWRVIYLYCSIILNIILLFIYGHNGKHSRNTQCIFFVKETTLYFFVKDTKPFI